MKSDVLSRKRCARRGISVLAKLSMLTLSLSLLALSATPRTTTVLQSPTLPKQGSWSGTYSSSFTVTSYYKIRGFSITVPWWPPPFEAECRITAVQDIPLGVVGLYTSLALDIVGNPHISYYDKTNGGLRYARWDGGQWVTETVDAIGGWYTSLVLDATGNPHITYYDTSNGDLKYARWDGVGWVITTVDSVGDVGQYTSLALDATGHHISCFDNTNGDLKYARKDGTQWIIEKVDTTGVVGLYTSLALKLAPDAAGTPHISYYDYTNGDLKYTRWDPASRRWITEAVDSTGDQGQYTSLVLNAAGNPHIAYHDASEGDLRYAAKTGSTWNREAVDSIVGGTGFILAY